MTYFSWGDICLNKQRQKASISFQKHKIDRTCIYVSNKLEYERDQEKELGILILLKCSALSTLIPWKKKIPIVDKRPKMLANATRKYFGLIFKFCA